MRAAGIALVLVLLGVDPVAAQEAVAGFSAAQAEHGGDLYRDHCSLCHGADLSSAEFAPSLKGARFRRQWGGQNAAALHGYVSRTMPPSQAGSLSPQDYSDVLAFILQANGASPGAVPLPSDPEALGALSLPK